MLMPHVPVAAHATDRVRGLPGLHHLDHVGVALQARALGHAVVARCDLQGVGIAAQRERVRVPEPVEPLGQVLRPEPVGRMAVVAHGHGLVALLALNMLQDDKLGSRYEWGSTAYVHLLTEALKLALLDKKE